MYSEVVIEKRSVAAVDHLFMVAKGDAMEGQTDVIFGSC